MIRRQLPAVSPLSPSALIAAGVSALVSRDEAGTRLADYLTERFAADAVRLTDSGTHALQVALELATAGSEPRVVALPGYSCYDLVTAAVGARVRVVFYDVDPRTLAPDLESVRSAFRGGARALVAGSLYGYPCDWDTLRAECRGAGAVLIEDSAQGLGSAWHGREGGSHGDLTIFSFGRGKGWTGGGGGALLLRGELAEADTARGQGDPETGLGARSLVMSFAQWTLSRPWLFGIPSAIPALHVGRTVYKAPTPVEGMDAIPAAVVLRHAELSRREALGRAARAEGWRVALAGARGVRIPEPVEGGTSGYLRLPVLVDPDALGLLDSERGASAGVGPSYPIPLHRLEAAQPILADSAGALPGAEALSSSLRTLPTHSRVVSADVRAVAALLAGGRP